MKTCVIIKENALKGTTTIPQKSKRDKLSWRTEEINSHAALLTNI